MQDDDVIVAMLANFIPYKNHNLILNSIKELINKTTIQFKFLFIGQDRGIKKILVKSIDQLQISSRVCFIENVIIIFKIMHSLNDYYMFVHFR